MIDRIDTERAAGRDPYGAIVLTSMARFRPGSREMISGRPHVSGDAPGQDVTDWTSRADGV